MVCCVNCSVPFFPWVLLQITAVHYPDKTGICHGFMAIDPAAFGDPQQSADIFQNIWKL